ncbi:MAG: hypothetical protein U9R34_00010 [Nanoarchaeota archaeon]|nr:hypothetical protein [Nanoarchaeota archaeon]
MENDITEKIKANIRKKRQNQLMQTQIAGNKSIETYNENPRKGNTLSIVQKYYDTVRTTGRQNHCQTSISYKDIQKVVREINCVQGEFENMNKRANAKGLQSLVLRSYDYIMKSAGMQKQYHSNMELFDTQIYNVSCLNKLLGAMVMNSSSELNVLKGRVNKLINEEENSYHKFSVLEEKLPGMITQLGDTKKLFQDMKQSDNKYFSMQRELINQEREVDESYSIYNILKQKSIGYARHRQNLTYMESLFRISLNNAKNLASITKHIGETLMDNRNVFYECKNLAYASAAVNGGLDVLSDYNKKLNQEFITGVKNIQAFIHNNDNLKMIDDSNHNIHNLIEDIRTIGYKQDMISDTIMANK